MRIFVLCVVFFSSTAFAGVFGYDNYEECVLEKMKGQDANRWREVNIICRDKFPFPVDISDLVGFDKNSPISLEWSESGVRVVKNRSKYNIVSFELSFSLKAKYRRKDPWIGGYINTTDSVTFDKNGNAWAPSKGLNMERYDGVTVFRAHGFLK